MSWIMWVAILIAWPLAGVVVAYLFGRFTHQAEAYDNAAEFAPPVVSYLRPAKRARHTSRAIAQSKSRQAASAGRRVH